MSTIQKKICLLGDFSVGKTSLVRRYVEGSFGDQYLSTIGVKVSRKSVQVQGGQLNLLIWDLAGGDKFSGHDKNYLRGAAGALLVFDLTRPETLGTLTKYAQQMDEINPGAPMVVAGNKSDLIEGQPVQMVELDALCEATRSEYLLTSAKTGDNVEAIILKLVAAMLSGSDSFAA